MIKTRAVLFAVSLGMAASAHKLHSQGAAKEEFHPSAADVRGSFQQTGKNCPSVAVAKWVIATFGVNTPTGPFSKLTTQRGTSLVLADGSTILLTAEQLKLARQHSQYEDKESTGYKPTLDAAHRAAIIEEANAIYAAEAIQLSNAKDRRKIQAGDTGKFVTQLKKLDASKHEVDDDFQWLNMSVKDVKKLETEPNTFVFGNQRDDTEQPHVTFGYMSGSGPIYDEYGTAASLASFDAENHSGGILFWRYALLSKGGEPIQVARQCAFPAGDAKYQWLKDPSGKGTCKQ
ncbi:hypothetical protein HDF16_000127 [Granulicella aggregans]|uniref:Uncharacterized protein n=1 Tax=Granulicella aggregans TaxID=474949 RepID=A0A7W8E157_9BACT|nr:hypothetical protein [Granulicella aggregans]MBB5055458.1 hypothetical protein [Granulicella aggregans]